MKRLILMRHAKSGWSDLATTDHERTLSDRGRWSAAAMGDWLREHYLIPDHVLCSDAARTRETLSRLKLEESNVSYSRSLYLAEPDVMAAALQAQDHDCILMVAHNPGSETLARMLLTTAPDHPDFANFPTCATLVADFDIPDWQHLKFNTGTAAHFTVPRDLIE